MLNLPFDFDIMAFRAGITAKCTAIFSEKLQDYGPTWLIFRDVSFADQLWIKIRRIRTLEEKGGGKINEGRDSEFLGIINYSAIMLMLMSNKDKFPSPDEVIECSQAANAVSHQSCVEYYKSAWETVNSLFERKNHDYGGAWADMHPHSITDQILIKIQRIKSITENGGKLLASEGIDAQLMDIINYCIFGLAMLE